MRKRVTMRRALSDSDLLADALPGPSWVAWRALLVAMMGEPLLDDERAIYRQLTGRDHEPGEMVDTFLAVIGRRGGKSRAMAVACVYLACLCDWSDVLTIGERGLAVFLSPSEKQSRVIARYSAAIIENVPLLAGLITNKTAEVLSLSTGIDLEIMAANWRRARGGTAVVVCLDECSYLHSTEDSGNRDEDIYQAIKPSLATTGGPMLLTSSPAAMEGITHRLWKRHHGAAGDPRILVVQAASRDTNPKLSQAVVDRAFEDDPTSAEAEWLGQFKQAVSVYLPRAVIEKAVDDGIVGRVALPAIPYVGFVDTAGGSGGDSFACAVGHKHLDDGRDVCILDAIFIVAPPFDPDQTTLRCAAFLRSWGISSVTGDSYAAMWPVTAFAKYGISYVAASLSKSEIYLHTLPLFTAGRVRLLDNPRIVDQFAALRRKVGSNGRESVDHPKGAHDDLANSIAGVLWKLSPVKRQSVTVGPVVVTAPVPDVFGNTLGEADSAFGWATRHGAEDVIFMRADAGSGADRFSFGGRGF
jgi:hypothetical protein